MFKSQIIKEGFVATVLMIFFSFLLNLIPFKFEFLKVIRQGFLGFDIYDLYYSGRNLKNIKRDSTIIIIEIADNRESIAEQIQIIQKYSPAALGIDAVFEKAGAPFEDAKLVKSLIGQNNIVLASRYTMDSTPGNTSFQYSFFDDSPHQFHSGYINMLGNPYSVIRNYPPFLAGNDSVHLSFSSALVKLYSAESYNKLKERNNPLEIINYMGNVESYTSLTAEELNYYDTSNQLENIIANKIVLLGYFKKTDPLVLEDLHFSPLNTQVIGKSFPDMYGVIIHANIISMIINGTYARQMPDWFSFMLAGIFTFLFLSYILSKHVNNKHPGHGYFLILQFLLLLLALYIFLQVFNLLGIKVPLLPIMISLVISVEFLGIYKIFALWLNKHFRYKTVFN